MVVLISSNWKKSYNLVTAFSVNVIFVFDDKRQKNAIFIVFILTNTVYVL